MTDCWQCSACAATAWEIHPKVHQGPLLVRHLASSCGVSLEVGDYGLNVFGVPGLLSSCVLLKVPGLWGSVLRPQAHSF